MTRSELVTKLKEAKANLDILLHDLEDPTAGVDGVNSSIEDLIHELDALEASEDDWDE